MSATGSHNRDRHGDRLYAGKRLESSAQAATAGIRLDELETENVHRAGIANVPSDSECPVPNLLGLQSAAFGQHCHPADSDYHEHVPAYLRTDGLFPDFHGAIHLRLGEEYFRAHLPSARAKENLPIHCCHHVLISNFEVQGLTAVKDDLYNCVVPRHCRKLITGGRTRPHPGIR